MNRLLFSALLAALLIAGCGEPSADEASAPIAPAAETAAVEADDASTWAERIKIKNPTNEAALVEFKRDGERIKVEIDPEGTVQVLRAERKGDKRKYEQDGRVIAEIKYGDDGGFKLRTPEGQLLWKVKRYDDGRIKISDNEENLNPYTLRPKEEDRVKVKREEAELGAVKFYADRGKMKVKDEADVELFESNTDRFSGAYGVLLMEDIEPVHQYILIAELLAQGV